MRPWRAKSRGQGSRRQAGHQQCGGWEFREQVFTEHWLVRLVLCCYWTSRIQAGLADGS